jgi:uncharacterized protein YutE (UPF0331/DUF86 family)
MDGSAAPALLEELLRATADLRRYASDVDRARFESERDANLMVRSALYLAAQAALDLAHHLVRVRGLRTPVDYKDAFESLREGGLISPELAAAMKDWAGFRNVLAHIYTRLDLDRVHDKRTADRVHLDEFARIAASLLGTNP